MTKPTTDSARAQQKWDVAQDDMMNYQMADLFGDLEEAHAFRLHGITACIELADLIRAGADLPMGFDPANREEFLAGYPEGSDAQTLIDGYLSANPDMR